ncbi:RusA family crossover junction endodeoxyribonuclease [Geobacillus thermodenitrificans]|uniref:RusA family crossover junction endodeoxyribonuclease n=1 Tax=Geobacillus thermodenitrificans TaxID=33940 RepID=UPI003D1FC2D6
MSEKLLKIKLTIPLPISINKLYINQYVYDPKTKKWIPTGKRIMSEEGKKLKEQIQLETIKQLQSQEWDYEWTKTNYIYQDCYIYMNRMGRDDNNIFKLLNDSLEKIVYENDSRVLTRTQRILIDKYNPRVELVLSQTPFIGIFDDKEQLKKFESKCKTCRRYKNNCSILKKAKEGRIQKEIDENLNCIKYKKE